jgi:putative transcriptional regulator
MAVVNNIKELREDRGAAQKDIADQTGFSTRTIRAVERGERDPSAEFMLRIAAYFNLMVEDIFQIKSD